MIAEKCSRFVIWLPNNSLSSELQNKSHAVGLQHQAGSHLDRWCGRREDRLWERLARAELQSGAAGPKLTLRSNPTSIGLPSCFSANRGSSLSETCYYITPVSAWILCFHCPAQQGFQLWRGPGWAGRKQAGQVSLCYTGGFPRRTEPQSSVGWMQVGCSDFVWNLQVEHICSAPKLEKMLSVDVIPQEKNFTPHFMWQVTGHRQNAGTLTIFFQVTINSMCMRYIWNISEFFCVCAFLFSLSFEKQSSR